MRAPLNLATRPVRNERLPGLVFLVAAFAMFLVTVQHATIIYRLLPARSKALRAEVADLRKESESLDIEKTQLARLTATTLEKTEWSVMKSLVDRRTFWWSQLFEVLERALPRAVKVVTVTPRVRDTRYFLDMTVRAETVEDGFTFSKDLERREEFADVTVGDVARNQGASGTGLEAEFRLTMRYLIPSGTSPSGASAAAGPADPAARPSPAAAAAAPAATATPPLQGVVEGDAQLEPEPEPGDEEPPAGVEAPQ